MKISLTPANPSEICVRTHRIYLELDVRNLKLVKDSMGYGQMKNTEKHVRILLKKLSFSEKPLFGGNSGSLSGVDRIPFSILVTLQLKLLGKVPIIQNILHKTFD